MSNVEIVLTVVGLLLTVAGGYVALRLKPLEDTDTSLERRLDSLHDDIKGDREKLDKRLGEIEKTYLSRAELTAAIKDLRDNFDKGIDRVESVMRALGSKVDHLADRVGKVEAS